MYDYVYIVKGIFRYLGGRPERRENEAGKKESQDEFAPFVQHSITITVSGGVNTFRAFLRG
jgi:hypothetical protein